METDMAVDPDHPADSDRPADPGAGTRKLVLTKRQYLAMRLEEIGGRLKEMTGTREALTRRLREGGLDGPAAREARQRRAYAAARILALREEKACLQAEKAEAPAGGPPAESDIN